MVWMWARGSRWGHGALCDPRPGWARWQAQPRGQELLEGRAVSLHAPHSHPCSESKPRGILSSVHLFKEV